jgi:hypothetical protein
MRDATVGDHTRHNLSKVAGGRQIDVGTIVKPLP